MANRGKRRLAAIMFTDIVGYSKFMLEDEKHGLLLRKRHKEIFEKCTKFHDGRVIQYYGDGTLSIFESAVSAVECGIAMQREFQKEPQVPLRIGIHMGDIHYDDTEVFGHGVNLAARIEPICNPGGIFISDKIYDEIKNHSDLNAEPLGIFNFKNIEREIGLFAIKEKGILYPDKKEIEFIKELTNKISIASAAEKSDAIRRYKKIIRRKKRKQMMPWLAGIIILLLSIIAFGQFKDSIFPNEVIPHSNDISIAVLPFSNMSGSDQNEYFSDGITEDILTLLSKIDGFSVTSRTSVMQYKNTKKSMRKIGKELAVEHLLEGSVRRDGNKVRITAQLIDAERDEHLWAKTYDKEIDNIFEVQSEVAKDIAQHLKKNLSPSDHVMIDAKPTSNVVAYEEYKKGLKYYRNYNKEDNDSSIICFNKALNADPEYAFAFAGLGDAYAQKAFHNNMDQALLDSSAMFSQIAVSLDPNLSAGYKSLGLAYHYKGEKENALESYHKAIELDPYNDMASNNIGQIEIEKGNYREGYKWAKHTLDINKTVPSSILNLARIYYKLGDDELTKVILDDGIATNPEIPEFRELKGEVLMREGQLEAAKKEAETLIAIAPESHIGHQMMGEIFIYEGDWEKADQQFAEAMDLCSSENASKISMIESMDAFVDYQMGNPDLAFTKWNNLLDKIDKLEQSEGHLKGFDLFKGSIYAAMGNEDKALEFLKKAKDDNWMDYKVGLNHPLFKNISDNKEFQDMMYSIKLKTDSIRTTLPKSST